MNFKLLTKFGVKRGKQDFKVASFIVLINTSIIEAPICIVLEKKAELNGARRSLATQFIPTLKQLASLQLKVNLLKNNQLFTGQNKTYKNIFSYKYQIRSLWLFEHF